MNALLTVISANAPFALLDNKYFRKDKVAGFATGQTILDRNFDLMVVVADDDLVERLAASGQPFINIAADVWTWEWRQPRASS